jgi:type I restriction enzyme S subunit
MPNLSNDALATLLISIPPLEAQRRIVDILDRAASIRRLRRQAQETARQIVPALFTKMFGDPGTNPMGWPVVEMQSLFREKPRYGTMAPATTEPKEFLCLRVANIQDDCLSLESLKYVSGDAINDQRHIVADGDLLLARAIASLDLLGKCFVAYPGTRKWAFDSHVMMCRFKKSLVDPEYISSFLKSPAGRREFLSHTRNSAVQFNINSKEFSSIILPLPPIELQAEFVHRVKDLLRIAERQRAAEAAGETAAQALQARLLG